MTSRVCTWLSRYSVAFIGRNASPPPYSPVTCTTLTPPHSWQTKLSPGFGSRSSTGQKLWGQQLGGAIGGGVITYAVDGAQKVAAAFGFTHPVWPTKIVTAKIAVLGLDNSSASQ